MFLTYVVLFWYQNSQESNLFYIFDIILRNTIREFSFSSSLINYLISISFGLIYITNLIAVKMFECWKKNSSYICCTFFFCKTEKNFIIQRNKTTIISNRYWCCCCCCCLDWTSTREQIAAIVFLFCDICNYREWAPTRPLLFLPKAYGIYFRIGIFFFLFLLLFLSSLPIHVFCFVSPLWYWFLFSFFFKIQTLLCTLTYKLQYSVCMCVFVRWSY